KSISKFLNATLTKEAIVAAGGYEMKKEDASAEAGKKKESVADIAAGAGNVSADAVSEEVRKMSGSKTPSLSQG
ncbi:MAG: hypothetical protein QG567_472, partial [Campylobacterota bacterium]|nr:hypothetical protein [Campylobacterota bacterium]